MRAILTIASAALLAALLILAALDIRLPGPAGQSATFVYRSLRVWARDVTTPQPPTIVGLSNQGPNVIVLLLDCFRADYLDGYAPAFSEFAQRNWYFDSHFAAAHWTKPSTASLFTGLLPRRHGVIVGGGQRLPEQATTLAEHLRAHGFYTSGIVQNVHLTRSQAFDQGFDHYVDNGHKGSKGVLHDFFSWLDRERPARFFSYVHFLGTHDSYYYDNDPLAILRAPRYPGTVNFATIDYKHRVADRTLVLSSAEVAHLTAIARAKALRVDRDAVAEFLERFYESELPENTLLIITSDHGDGFNEHGFVSHGFTIYNEEIHVPLAIYFPPSFASERGFNARGRHSCPSSTVDLAPTVLDFLNLPNPAGLDGASLIPPSADRDACPRPVVSERAGGGRIDGAALMWGRSKLIVNYRGEPRYELFDLGLDPGETRDLSGERPEDAARLRAELERRLNADGSSLAAWASEEETPISKELQQQMRALGYLD